MKYDFTLTSEQQVLVEQNLSLVDKAISRYIRVNENVCDLSYDDLCQEGRVALCRAAQKIRKDMGIVVEKPSHDS